MEEHYKAFLGTYYNISCVLWDCQLRTKHCAAYNFYSCTENLHVSPNSIINGFKYDETGPRCCMVYCQICGECAQGLEALYSGNVQWSRGQAKGLC